MTEALSKGNLLYEGKAKSVYATQDPEVLWLEFRDDTTAFDGVKHEQLAGKGKLNCAISTFITKHLEKHGVASHILSKESDTVLLVRRLDMLPIESVIRNRAAGSVCRRLGLEQGMQFSSPLYELFYKDDELHDPLINRNHARLLGWATDDQMDQVEAITFLINQVLQDLLTQAGLILVDAKFEFGVDASGTVYLADEISPDSCRIWEQDTLRPLDKDRFRQDLGGVTEAYQEFAERIGVSL